MLEAAMERTLLGEPRRGLLHRRRPAPLRELRTRGQPPHDDRARGAHALGEPGVHPADARRGAPRDGAQRGRERRADRRPVGPAAPGVPGALRRQGGARSSSPASIASTRASRRRRPRTCWCAARGRRRRAWPPRSTVSSPTPTWTASRSSSRGACPTPISPTAALQALRDKFGPGRWSLADRGYLAGVHPLELWVAAYLREHPKATLGEAVAASARAAAGGLPVAVQDAPQGRAGRAHPQPARSGCLRRDPEGVAAPGLSVRIADALVRDRARRLGRPARGAGRADGHHRQPRHAPAGGRAWRRCSSRAARRTRRDWRTSRHRPNGCSSPRSPTWCGAR